ncbi:hypothetical protein D3C71_1590060 [compost metagenome]
MALVLFLQIVEDIVELHRSWNLGQAIHPAVNRLVQRIPQLFPLLHMQIGQRCSVAKCQQRGVSAEITDPSSHFITNKRYLANIAWRQLKHALRCGKRFILGEQIANTFPYTHGRSSCQVPVHTRTGRATQRFSPPIAFTIS